VENLIVELLKKSVLATGIVLVEIAILSVARIVVVVKNPKEIPLEVLRNMDLDQEMFAGALDRPKMLVMMIGIASISIIRIQPQIPGKIMEILEEMLVDPRAT
jgi:hypothetical protein